MSFINEALKRAQEEKESRDPRTLDIPEMKNMGRGGMPQRILLYSISVLLLTIILILILLWLGSSGDKVKTTDISGAPPQAQPADNASASKELYDKALDLYKKGRISEAKKLYEAAVGLDPGNIEALNNLAIIYIKEKNFTVAQDNLEKAVRLNPGYAESYYNLACLHAVKGEIGQGVGYLKKAVSLDSDVREWANTDSDLTNLRASGEFNSIVSP